MKKILSVLCVLAVIMSCQAGTKGNKKITSVEKSISDYSGISLAGSEDIIYEQKPGQSPYLRVEIDENLQQYVKVGVKDGTLHVSLDGKNLEPSKFNVYTNSTSLSRVSIGGSGDLTLKNDIKSSLLEIAIGGSGDFSASKLQCNEINIAVNGSGDAKLGGSATTCNAAINGSGDIDAAGLTTKTTNCAVNGSGDIKLYATDELSAAVNGSGDIHYKGSPKKLNKIVKGSGDISSF